MSDQVHWKAAIERNKGQLGGLEYSSPEPGPSLHGAVSQPDVLSVDGDDGSPGEVSNLGKPGPAAETVNTGHSSPTEDYIDKVGFNGFQFQFNLGL